MKLNAAWLAAHKVPVMLAGGAGVVGLALFKSHKASASPAGTTIAPANYAGNTNAADATQSQLQFMQDEIANFLSSQATPQPSSPASAMSPAPPGVPTSPASLPPIIPHPTIGPTNPLASDPRVQAAPLPTDAAQYYAAATAAQNAASAAIAAGQAPWSLPTNMNLPVPFTNPGWASLATPPTAASNRQNAWLAAHPGHGPAQFDSAGNYLGA